MPGPEMATADAGSRYDRDLQRLRRCLEGGDLEGASRCAAGLPEALRAEAEAGYANGDGIRDGIRVGNGDGDGGSFRRSDEQLRERLRQVESLLGLCRRRELELSEELRREQHRRRFLTADESVEDGGWLSGQA